MWWGKGSEVSLLRMTRGTRSDAITSAAAFIGISIALTGGEGYEAADDYAALFASFIIIYNAVSLLMPALKEVLDTAPPEEFQAKS